MPYIPRQTKMHKEPFTVRLDQSILQELDRYCRFLDSSRDYVIAQALEVVFRKDREYAAWLATQSQPVPEEAASQNTERNRPPKTEGRRLEAATTTHSAA